MATDLAARALNRLPYLARARAGIAVSWVCGIGAVLSRPSEATAKVAAETILARADLRAQVDDERRRRLRLPAAGFTRRLPP